MLQKKDEVKNRPTKIVQLATVRTRSPNLQQQLFDPALFPRPAGLASDKSSLILASNAIGSHLNQPAQKEALRPGPSGLINASSILQQVQQLE